MKIFIALARRKRPAPCPCMHAPTAIVYRKQWAPLNPLVELPPHLRKLSDFTSSLVITCTTSLCLSLQHCHGVMTCLLSIFLSLQHYCHDMTFRGLITAIVHLTGRVTSDAAAAVQPPLL